jgi:hypothetical protein
MTLRFSYGHYHDFEALAEQMADAQPNDHYPMTSQKRMAATRLEASARLGECDRQQLRIDLVDIAQRVVAGDSYAWPRLGGRGK